MAQKIEARGALAHGPVERNPASDVRPGAALKGRKMGH